MRRIPIRLRIAAAFAVAMAVVLAGTGALLYERLDHQLTTALDRQLRLRSDDLSALATDPEDPLALPARDRLVEAGESFAEILAPGGRVVRSTAPLRTTPLLDRSETARGLRHIYFSDRPSVPGLDEPARVLARRILVDGRPYVLVVGSTKQDRAETLASLRDELLIAGPIALLLATVAGYGLAGVSLHQVESMRRRAASISAATPGERLPVPPTRDELQRLGETLNAMLARLEAALARERAFVADAGHELRTPLALLRTELELALRYAASPEELHEAVRRSSLEVDRLAQLAEDLLLIARSDSDGVPLRLETLHASELLSSIASRFEWRAQEDGRPVRAAPGDVELRGDRLRLEQALGNMVDNALRYGAGEVRLSAARANGAVELHVTDEGAGFAPDFLDQAFERFTRSDHARTGGGSGLGLSIVQVIAEAHGGSAHAVNDPAGGADVWLSLPADARPRRRSGAPA